ncbi:MAG: hypothetical protein N2234_01280 [Planctomycetota bacterium]|nr:hypothetical protein [Planctomycetota bacterium]
MKWLWVIFLTVVVFTVSGCVAVDYYDYVTYTDEYETRTVPVRERVLVPDWERIGDLLILGAFLHAVGHTRVKVYHEYPPYRGRCRW